MIHPDETLEYKVRADLQMTAGSPTLSPEEKPVCAKMRRK